MLKRMTHSGNLFSTVKDVSATTSVKVMRASGPFDGFRFPVEPETQAPVIAEDRTSGSSTACAGFGAPHALCRCEETEPAVTTAAMHRIWRRVSAPVTDDPPPRPELAKVMVHVLVLRPAPLRASHSVE